MSYMLYTSPGRGQSKVARVQDLQGKKRKTRSSHTIISISALNVFNNVNIGFSRVSSGLLSSAWLRQMSTVKKTGQRGTSRNQYWALDPDNRVRAVSKIAASFGVPWQSDFEFGGSACCHKFAKRSVQNILQAITINNVNTFK